MENNCLPENKHLNVDITDSTTDIAVGLVKKWRYGAEAVAPLAGATLISETLDQTYPGRRIYGYTISAEEGNSFRLSWVRGGGAISYLIVLPVGGTIVVVLDYEALNDGYLADAGSVVSITVVAAAAAGKKYQAGVMLA
jgi:hypothetical protein